MPLVSCFLVQKYCFFCMPANNSLFCYLFCANLPFGVGGGLTALYVRPGFFLYTKYGRLSE